MLSAPNSRATSAASASILSCERTSSLMAFLAFRPLSLSSTTSVAMTAAPSAIKVSAIARPMPWPAAVTSATLFCNRLLMLISLFSPAPFFIQRRETNCLQAFVVEILRREPALEVALAHRPLAVEHGEPGVIAVAALGNHVLAERAFVDKAVTQRGTP